MMGHLTKTILILSIGLYCWSCDSTPKKDVETTVQENEPVENEQLKKPSPDLPKKREPYDDEIREYGRVVGLEDGPYPMFTISIEFPKRKLFRDFNLNIEAISLNVEELNNLQNQYVTLYYTSELDVNLYDLQLNGKTVLGPDAFSSDNAKEFTGILTGAESATESDLPDQLTITPPEGEPLTFKYFVTEEMTRANNQEVTAFYSTRTLEKLTYLEASEERGE